MLHGLIHPILYNACCPRSQTAHVLNWFRSPSEHLLPKVLHLWLYPLTYFLLLYITFNWYRMSLLGVFIMQIVAVKLLIKYLHVVLAKSFQTSLQSLVLWVHSDALFVVMLLTLHREAIETSFLHSACVSGYKNLSEIHLSLNIRWVKWVFGLKRLFYRLNAIGFIHSYFSYEWWIMCNMKEAAPGCQF